MSEPPQLYFLLVLRASEDAARVHRGIGVVSAIRLMTSFDTAQRMNPRDFLLLGPGGNLQAVNGNLGNCPAGPPREGIGHFVVHLASCGIASQPDPGQASI